VKIWLEVKNFGPVAKGKLLIKPLTVFIGPNNTGKSHISMLYYAILTTFTRSRYLYFRMRKMEPDEALSILSDRLKNNIERVFSSRISDLIKWGSQAMEIWAILEDETVKVSCHISAESSGGFPKVEIEPRSRNTLYIYRSLRALMRLGNVHYLPASRAGLLQNYRAIVSSLIRQIPYALFMGSFEIPEITGVVADFLAEFVTGSIFHREDVDVDVRAINEFFEREIAEGELVLELRGEAKIPELSYRTKEGAIPLYRMSSMLVELAPLGVYLKYGVLKRGDFLVIEEPESHLHPDKQVKVAELLAMLVNKLGLNVLVTTHSDILLAKLSNLVALSSIPEEKARAQGFNPELAIDKDKIAVYSFRRDEEGVVVEEVKVTERGIPDDVFRKVIEELYEESMDLYYRIQELTR